MKVSSPRVQWILVLSVLIGAACCSTGSEDPRDGAFRWRIATAVEIDAPPARVWEVLVDLPAYAEWNPFVVQAAGKVAVGETLSLRMALPGWEPMTIEPRLLVVEPGRELRWTGRLLLPGLFDGEHAFLLTSLEDGRTRVDHVEDFAGLLLPLAKRLIHAGTVASFHALDAALAERAAAESDAPLREANTPR
jgi:hypothetical protein